MIKLGLGIQITQRGINEPQIINDGQWSQNIIDVRYLLSILHSNGVSCSNIPISFSYTNDGMLITLMREIKGRKSDNVSAFIFVPKEIDICSEELYDVVTTVKQELCKSSLDIRGLKELFNKEYPKKSIYVAYKESADTGYAYRIVPNRYSLKELLGDERYQEYYTKYQNVFILGNEDFDENTAMVKAETTEKSLTNLTDRELETYCSLILPSEEEIRSITQLDIVLKFENGEPVNQVITKLKGEKIILYCQRQGFETIKYSYEFTKLGDEFDSTQLKDIEWLKRFFPDYFFISDIETNKSIEGCNIFLDDKKIKRNGVLITESQTENLLVTITHPDYKTFKRTLNLKNRSSFNIMLEPEEVKYTYGIGLKGTYGEGELSFISKRKLKHEISPLDHYKLDHGMLIYDKDKERKKIRKYSIRYFVIGIVLSSLVWSAVILLNPGKTKDCGDDFPEFQRYELYQPNKSLNESSTAADSIEDDLTEDKEDKTGLKTKSPLQRIAK